MAPMMDQTARGTQGERYARFGPWQALDTRRRIRLVLPQSGPTRSTAQI